ncbi:protein kinase domain-containing protein [Arthrobacter sp. HLT1-20]
MELHVSPAGAGQPPIVAGFDAVRCLGSGAQGQVWLLAPRNGGPAVAAKILAVRADGDRAGGGVASRHNESYITQELRILMQFRHEHLIPVHGVVHDSGGTLVLLMDHAAGGSVGQLVRASGPLTVGETVTVLTPLGQVLSFLHGRGAVHGDVSAGNVLLSAAGKPYLGDFGLGRLLGQGPAELAGTPGFVCGQDAERNEASDVFGMAAVGWFALTGHVPPASHNRLPLTTFVPEVPAELLAALEAGLNEDARQRPTAAAFAQAVFRSARAEPVALANAVHPSVLPELLTRQESLAKGRRGKRGGVRGTFPRILPRWRGADEPTLRRWPRRGLGARDGQRLGRLWDDDGRRVSRHGVSGHHSGGHGGGGRLSGVVRGRAAAAVSLSLAVLILGAGALFLVPTWFNGVDGAHQAAPALPRVTNSQHPSMAWAAALPAEIQRGLVAQEPVEALAALAWTRSHAFSTADGELLGNINAQGSPALAADAAVLSELARLGHRLTGLDSRIGQAELAGPAAEGRATVQASVTTSPFAEQDAQGAIVHNHDREQTQELAVVLTHTDGRWVIERTLPVGTEK